MNTLNNQQINPGNRVDFSKIRGSIKVRKFEDPNGPLEWDWTDLQTDLTSAKYTGSTSTNGLTQNLQTDAAELEKQPEYIAFTDYILGLDNPTGNDLTYLQELDRVSSPNASLLFDDDDRTILKQDWKTTFQKLRTDKMAGPFHYTPARLAKPYVAPPVEESTTYATPSVIPEYEHSLWTDPLHLSAIYGNNIRGALKTADLATKYKAPTVQATQYDAVVTDGYAERAANEQAVADARARYAEMASNTSNADSARQMMQDFESQVAVPTQIKNNAIKANEFATTTQNVQKTQNLNQQLRTDAANANHQSQVAEYNNRLLAKQKLNAAVTAETSDLIQKLDSSHNQYTTLEKSNMNHHQMMVNQHMYTQGIKQAMLERDNALKDIVESDEYKYVLREFFQKSGYENMNINDRRAVLQDPYNLETVLPILQKYPDIDEIQALVSSIRGTQSTIQKEFDRKVIQLQNQLAEANLYTRQEYSSSPGYRRDALDMDWRKLFGTRYKKGGKVEDRLLKYLEHKRKVLKDQQERNTFVEKEANTKLRRELDSLDRETLLLLRSIFK